MTTFDLEWVDKTSQVKPAQENWKIETPHFIFTLHLMINIFLETIVPFFSVRKAKDVTL